MVVFITVDNFIGNSQSLKFYLYFKLFILLLRYKSQLTSKKNCRK